MVRTLYYVASSIDGFIADSDDRIDWLLQFGFETFDEHYQRFLAGIGAIVMGAGTYEFLIADANTEWPYAGIPTWVVTHREFPVVDGAAITFSSGDITALDTELRAVAGDRDVGVVGGGSIAAQFADAGLLDELQLTVMPILVGSGRPVLPVGQVGRPLELLRTTPFPGGAVEHVYKLT
jgi:dihydrofolate reductase